MSGLVLPLRFGSMPANRYCMGAWAVMAMALSKSATSQYWPAPVWCRAISAASTVLHTMSEVPMSITGDSARTPSRSA